MQIRAIAIKSGYTNSQSVSATYTVGSGVNSTPWQMLVSDNHMDYRMNCELTEGDVVVYYTSEIALANNVLLYTDDQLINLAPSGYYRDVNDRASMQIYTIEGDNGRLKTTVYTCKI